MNRIHRRVSLFAVIALCWSFAAAPFAFALNLLPGTLLGIDGDRVDLVSYSFSGAILDTLHLTGLPNTPIGVAVLGNRAFVGDVSGNVGEVNLLNGSVFNLFNGLGNEAIGDNGTNLLTYNYSDGNMREYTTTGILLNTVPLPTGGTGIDGTSSRIYLGMYDVIGDIRVFNAGGAFLNTIVTGIPNNSMSALGLDSSNNTLWVATGFGDDRIRHFDLAGNLLGNFPANMPWINGLDVIPVPEPASILLGCLALAALTAASRRRLRQL